MKAYKVTIEIRDKIHPYIGVPENRYITVISEHENDIPGIVLESLDIPEDKIYWQMCWCEKGE